jgi:putative ubiquitin-RnfH superfamily antitoxin RatB of RatAB toxin-antitoxin module
MNKTIPIEIAYALPAQQIILKLQIEEGATAEQAIRISGIMEKFPEIDLEQNKIGIFGKLGKLDTVLREHDRVEIYRPLIADPKEVRRQRAAEGKAMKKGGGELAAE